LDTKGTEHSTLRGRAIAAIMSVDPEDKAEWTERIACDWFDRKLSLHALTDPKLPDTPGRPPALKLVVPKQVPQRNVASLKGRISLLHSIAHIELNAVDLALDIVARFADEPMPRSFFDGWMQVAREEAKHFRLVRARLLALGAEYGDLPAHDGLWQSAHDTRHDLACRLAIVPLILEARGLDVTPSLQAKMREVGDHKSADVLEIIYQDEKGHVGVGAKWFRFLCARFNQDPVQTFQALVRLHFRGPLKPPFNDVARAAAGLTPSFYRNLSAVSAP